MIDQKKFFECLQDVGVEFITGVPDSLLNEFCLYALAELHPDRHVIAANEGNAIALAAGYHLVTGSVPLVYMQNSGLGNATNPLLSLTNKEVYAIPMVILIGWRGAPGTKDHVHHKKQGELTPIFLEHMDIPYRIIDSDGDEVLDAAKWAVLYAKKINSPVALLAAKGIFAKKEKDTASIVENRFSMSRENAIECIIDYLPSDTIFVVTTGRATRELFDLRNLHGSGHANDFLNVGAMGHVSSIATGMALAQKDRLVVCLDGDGAAIMHLGALTSMGKLGLTNFLHVILNNGAHESVGGQPTAGFKANLTAMAENAGYKTVGKPVETEQALRDAVQRLVTAEGPKFIDVRIRQGIRSDLGSLTVDLGELKDIFLKSMKGLK